jgi:Flp pilus assembly protein TadG
VPALRARLHGQEGVVAILTAILMVVLLASVAFAIDVARIRHARQVAQASVDLGSLAGADLLPVQGAAAAATAKQAALNVALANDPQLNASQLQVTFTCVVSDPEGDGGADSPDIDISCGPAIPGSWTTGWTSKQGKAFHVCNPDAGDTCNAIVLTAADSVNFYFAPVIGINQGSTGAVSSVACRGFCGQAATPLDVMMVIDRTTSMSAADLQQAKGAADSVLQIYNPRVQHVGLTVLPYGGCNAVNQTNPNTGSAWNMVPLNSNYRNTNGTLNPASALVQAIGCLNRATGVSSTPNPARACSTSRPMPAANNLCGGQTNLGDPMLAAANYLRASGRSGVPHVIIFMTDGEANQPMNSQPCQYAYNKGQQAEALGTTIYTIGFGVAYSAPRDGLCYNDYASNYTNGPAGRGAYATTVLAAMASVSDAGIPPTDNLPGGCASDENSDGDNYFCLPKTEDLTAVFQQVAVSSLQHSRLLNG